MKTKEKPRKIILVLRMILSKTRMIILKTFIILGSGRSLPGGRYSWKGMTRS